VRRNTYFVHNASTIKVEMFGDRRRFVDADGESFVFTAPSEWAGWDERRGDLEYDAARDAFTMVTPASYIAMSYGGDWADFETYGVFVNTTFRRIHVATA
jgi:hypothetical protein